MGNLFNYAISHLCHGGFFRRVLAVALTGLLIQSLSAATRQVQTVNDSGPGSLRQALAIATQGDIIAIRVTGTIFLESPLFILKSVQIRGPGTDKLIIDGQNKTLVFSVTNGVRASISDLTVSDAVNLVVSPVEGFGGAIQNFGTLILARCVVTDSTSEFSVGGGIATTGDLTVRQCTISHNAAFEGGGIANRGGSLVVDRSTIYANRSVEPGGSAGGGIFQIEGTAALVNSTISGNLAFDGNGGGLWASTPVLIESCTIVSNTANAVAASVGKGGGIFIHPLGSVEIHNTIIAGNTAIDFTHPAEGPITIGPDVFGNVISQGWNLIQNPADATITGVSTGNIFGQDPLLGPLQDNGGPTPTHALSAQSPAVDSGSPSGFPRTEQRGVLRPQDGNGDHIRRTDIGAYELARKGSSATPGMH